MKLSKKSTLTFARTWICLFILLTYQLLSKYNPAMSFEISCRLCILYYDAYSNVNCLELIWNQDSLNFFQASIILLCLLKYHADYVYHDDYSNVNCLELIWNQDSSNFFIKYLERNTNYDKTYFSIFITIELEKKSCYLLSKGPYWKKSQDPHYCNILSKIHITGYSGWLHGHQRILIISLRF